MIEIRHIAVCLDLEGNLCIDRVPGVRSLTLFLRRSRRSHGQAEESFS